MQTKTASLFVAPVLFAGLCAAQASDSCSPGHADELNIVETAAKAGMFNTLLTAATAAGLADTLSSKGPFTVFAPTDDAFKKLPTGTIPALLKDKKKLASILTYHVVAGRAMAKDVVGARWHQTVNGQSIMVDAGEDGVMIDGAKVIKTDIKCSNGVIHVIDSVMLPRADIVDTAVEAGSFKTLATAITKAKLIETLKSEGPFTVFAPTDSAFAKLPEGTITTLLKPENREKLAGILTYHVVPGRVLAEDIPLSKKGAVSVSPKTVQGQKLEIRRMKDGSVTVDGAKVVKADIICGNGVIHVIDSVVLPKN